MREAEGGLWIVKEIGSCAESQRRRRRQSFSYKSSLRCWELIYIRDSAVLFITNWLKMNRDPATETVVENNRQGIVALGPVQPRTITFPSSGSRNLKLIKTCSRSTSADVRSADLIQIYVECIRSSDLLLDDLVTAFAAKPRKLSL